LAAGTASNRLNFLAEHLNGTENPPKQPAIWRMSGEMSAQKSGNLGDVGRHASETNGWAVPLSQIGAVPNKH